MTTNLFPRICQIKNPTCFRVLHALGQLKQVMTQKHRDTQKVLTDYDPELVLSIETKE